MLIVEREITVFAIAFLETFALAGVLYLVSLLIIKKHKQVISVIYYLSILIMVHYFIIGQRDYIFNEYPTIAYSMIVLMLLGYYIFFRELFSFIKMKKSERVTSAKEIR